jgi:hypothetical protein
MRKKILKVILGFIFILMCFNNHAQIMYLPDLSTMIKQGEKDIDWKTIEVNRDEKLIKVFALNKKYLRGTCSRFEEQFSPNKTKKEQLELSQKLNINIHTVDLNQDGKLDIVYDGVCNPYRTVYIYLNQGKNIFKYALSTVGWISSIQVKDENCKIVIKDFACCASATNTLKVYEMKSKSMKIEEKCQIHYPMDMDLPSTFKDIRTFDYVSKTTPKIDPVKKNKDNMIVFEAIKLNPKGWILNELKNKEGFWYLALFPFKDVEHIYTLGWINNVSVKHISMLTIKKKPKILRGIKH